MFSSLAVALLCVPTAVADDAFLPRVPLAKEPVLALPAEPSRLVVKFRDDLLVRATPAGLVSLAGAEPAAALPLARAGASFSQLIDLPGETIAFLEQRAALSSGRAQPDLAGMIVVDAPDALLLPIALELNASPLVEWVQFQELLPPPPCDDLLPITPQYYPNLQGYHGPNPGMNMAAAWALGGRGAGIRVADCEYGVVSNHEDLCNIWLEPGQTPHPNVAANGWDEHGTAVFGELMSLDNGYGCTGLVPDAAGLFFPEWTVEGGSRRVTCIANAIATVDAGDVVLLEMQTNGAGGGYGPAELDLAVWTVVKNGADAGIIVVGAAGNGNQNLDSSPYVPYMNRGDSGAIIVGAGSSTASHNKLSFSTYGSRVNVQGWGENVFTLGYGSYAQHGGDKKQRYTAGFSGTSSASPFIAAAAASLQSVAELHRNRRLAPLEVRSVLIATGLPQGSGGHIGPFPSMAAAAKRVACFADFNLDGAINSTDFLLFLNAWSAAEPDADIDRDGAHSSIDILAFLNAYVAGCP